MERQRADEDWRINPKLSTKDMMISGLKGDLCEEFTARLESTKFADVHQYEGSWVPNKPAPGASNPREE